MEPRPISRRTFVAAASTLLVACRGFGARIDDGLPEGRLHSRPGRPLDRAPSGLHRLNLGGERDGVLYVPSGRSPNAPAPFIVLLHGATQDASLWPLEFLDAHFGPRGIVALIPESRGMSWDIRDGAFGPDVAFIDRALAFAF